MALPISMNPEECGKIVSTTDNQDGSQQVIVDDGKRVFSFSINSSKTQNTVSLLAGAELSWIDTKLEGGGHNSFIREIGKSTIVFLDGEAIVRKQELAGKPFRSGGGNSKFKHTAKFFNTFDIETRNEDGLLIPYLYNAYLNGEHFSFFGADSKLIFKEFIIKTLDFFKPEIIIDENDEKFDKNPNSRGLHGRVFIYAHNLSGFDGVFMMKQLFTLQRSGFGHVKPRVFNGKIYSIEFTYDGIKLIFKDSYLMIPASLRKLCKAFTIPTPKTYFPHFLNNIKYKGEIPEYKYWDDISKTVFKTLSEKFKGKEWNFRDESIKYCRIDCVALHKILMKFNSLIFTLFNMNITDSLTLPALAFKIFRVEFMDLDQIFRLSSNVEADIRQAYFGGHTDCYIPHNVWDIFNIAKNCAKKLFYYDVNSLYPYAMAIFPMPVGLPIRFKGNIVKAEPDAFGFFYCKILTPEHLDHPILPRRLKTKTGERIIYGLGSWEGWYFSEELYNATKYGYSFEVLHGYQFKKAIIFKKYIDKLYKLRLEYAKTHPMNYISKLLMNSLYGKFAMRITNTIVHIYDANKPDEYAKFMQLADTGDIEDIHKSDAEDFVLVIENQITQPSEQLVPMDINTAISAAVTAYGRIIMSKFKNNPLFNLFYSDTDSIVIDRQLPDSMIGDALGQLKLEYELKYAIFLAPKLYGLITMDDQFILKSKGITPKGAEGITFADLAHLLYHKNHIDIPQEKWMKSIIDGSITVREQMYRMSVTSGKRVNIYEHGIFARTESVVFDPWCEVREEGVSVDEI